MRHFWRLSAVLVAAAFFLSAPVEAQVPGGGVQQQGSVTANNCVKWVRNGVIADTGSTCGGGGGGSPGGSNGQIQYNNAGAFGGFTTSGDATINTGTGALTLATVNANVGSFGSATNCVAFTTNAKGLITAASQTTCTPAVASITGLGTGVATALAANMNSSTGPIGALTPTNNNCVVGNGTAWTSAACPPAGGAIQPVSGTSSTVPAMTAGSAVADTDVFYASQSSGTNDRKVTGAQVKTYANTSAVRSVTGTSDAMLNSDQNKLVRYCNASAIAATIAQAGSGGNFAAGWAVSLKNDCAGTVTVTATTSTFNPGTGGAGSGTATITLTQGQGTDLYSNGTDYIEQGGKGSGGAGTVTTTGTPANGNLTQFSGASSITNGNLSGDCTTSGTLVVTCRQSAPLYIATRWYLGGAEHAGTFSSGSVSTNGNMNCYPEYFHGPATIDALGARVNTTSAGGNFQVAIYANSAANGRPTGTALVSSASMSTASAAAVSTTNNTAGSPISVSIPSNQLVWYCLNSDNGTVNYNGILMSYQAAVIGTTTQASLQSGSAMLTALRYTQAFGTWPDLTSTAPTTEATSNSFSPGVHFRIGSVP